MKTKLLLLPFFAFVCFAFSGTTVDPISLIGKSIKSKEAKSLIKSSRKMDTYKSEDTYYYMFNSEGYDLCMTNDNLINSVFFFADGADKHNAYKGQLPFGLAITMNRETVETIMGAPEKNGGSGVISFYSAWESRGMCVTYESLDTMDPGNKIHHIAFYKPELK